MSLAVVGWDERRPEQPGGQEDWRSPWTQPSPEAPQGPPTPAPQPPAWQAPAPPGAFPPQQPGWSPGPSGPIPPGRPPSPSSPARVALVLAVVVVLVAALVGGLVVLSQDDGDGDDLAADRSSESSTSTTPSDSVEVPTLDEAGEPDEGSDEEPPVDEDRPVEPVDEVLVDFVDEEGGYRLDVPDRWGYAAISGDASGSGAQAFPDDPDLAAQFDQLTGLLPRFVLFVAVDPDTAGPGGGFTSNLTIAVEAVPQQPDADGLADLARGSVSMLDAELIDEREVTTNLGPGARIVYELPQVGAHGVQYYLYGEGNVWVITLTTADLPGNEALIDEMASSFELA